VRRVRLYSEAAMSGVCATAAANVTCGQIVAVTATSVADTKLESASVTLQAGTAS
jgi:hypothetical protein